MKAHVLNHFAGAIHGRRPARSVPAAGVLARLAAWLRVAAERRRLEDMPEHLLRDIGIDRGIANAEAGRPFWDLPAGRHDLS